MANLAEELRLLKVAAGAEWRRIKQAKSGMEKIKELREKVQRCHEDLAVEDRQGEKEADTPCTQRTEAADVGMAEPNVTPPPEVVVKDTLCKTTTTEDTGYAAGFVPLAKWSCQPD